MKAVYTGLLILIPIIVYARAAKDIDEPRLVKATLGGLLIIGLCMVFGGLFWEIWEG